MKRDIPGYKWEDEENARLGRNDEKKSTTKNVSSSSSVGNVIREETVKPGEAVGGVDRKGSSVGKPAGAQGRTDSTSFGSGKIKKPAKGKGGK